MTLLLLGVYFLMFLGVHSALAMVRTTHTAQHNATYQKTQIFGDTAVRMSNPAVTVLPADTGTEASSYIYLVSLLCFLKSLCIILCA